MFRQRDKGSLAVVYFASSSAPRTHSIETSTRGVPQAWRQRLVLRWRGSRQDRAGGPKGRSFGCTEGCSLCHWITTRFATSRRRL